MLPVHWMVPAKAVPLAFFTVNVEAGELRVAQFIANGHTRGSHLQALL